LVSEGGSAFEWRFWGRCLCMQKFRSRRSGSDVNSGRTCSRNSDFGATAIRDLGLTL